MFTSAIFLAGLAAAASSRQSKITIGENSVGQPSGVRGEIVAEQEEGKDIQFVIKLHGLAPDSEHAWQIYSNPVVNFDCSTAGNPFDPENKKTGVAGDLGNFKAGPRGNAEVKVSDPVASLFGEHAITDQSIVIHSKAEDPYNGNVEAGDEKLGGPRVACGNFKVTEVKANSAGPRKPDSCDGDQIQCVIEGDTLSKIAESHKLPLDKLVAANPQFSDNADLIFPGDKVCIPQACFPKRAPATCDGEILTKVKAGDTLFQLASANNLELDTIMEANPQLGPDFDLIFPGDQVCKPEGCPAFEPVEDNCKFSVVEEFDDAGETTAPSSDINEEDSGYSTAANLANSAESIAASVLVIIAAIFAF